MSVQAIEILAAILAGVGSIWAAWAKIWVGRIRPWMRRRKADHEIVQNTWVFNRTLVALHQWLAGNGAMRALCICASNCGSHWDAQKAVSINIVAEAHVDRVPRVFGRWQGWRADPPYRQMLGDIVRVEDRSILLVTEHMPDSVLRDHYHEQGVVASVLFRICITEDSELIYASLDFGQPSKDGQPLSDQQTHDWIEAARELHRRPERVREMIALGRQIWTD